MNKDPPPGTSAAPDPDNIKRWRAIIFGPEGTQWDGGCFRLSLSFTDEYPQKPPEVKFLTQGVFHPNVYADGSICLDILQSKWSPAMDVAAVLASLQSLLSDPNTNSPANQEAAQLFDGNRTAYDARVRACVGASLRDAEVEFDRVFGVA